MDSQKEVWLRGARDSLLAAELQPAADALLQAGEELEALLSDFPDALLWERPAGVAAVGFHLKHIAGVLDRLLSYAEGQMLEPGQLEYLKSEVIDEGHSTQQLLKVVQTGIQQTIRRYRKLDAGSLGAFRKVGRAGLPSTVIGLCFHAAEHTMRHTGQLLVTVAVLRKGG
ncbi:MAG: DinB family protein [Niabella sp.]|nr:DinB family protein [Niabella sp.]